MSTQDLQDKQPLSDGEWTISNGTDTLLGVSESHQSSPTEQPGTAPEQAAPRSEQRDVPVFTDLPQAPSLGAGAEQYTAEQFSSYMDTKPGSGSMVGLITAVVLLLLVLGSGGAYAYYQFMQGPSAPTLSAVAEAFVRSKTYKSSGEVAVSMDLSSLGTQPGMPGGMVTIEADVESLVDQKGIESQHMISMRGEFDDGSMSMRVSGEVELLQDGEDVMYVNIRKVPDLLTMFGFASLENRWIKLDLNEIEDVSAPLVQKNMPIPLYAQAANPFVRILTDPAAGASPEQRELMEYVEEHPMAWLGDPLGQEQVSDMAGGEVVVTKYPVELDMDAVAGLVALALEFLGDEQNISAKEVRAAQDAVGRILNAFSFDTLEVWVGENALPYRVIVDGALDLDLAALVQAFDDPYMEHEFKGVNRLVYTFSIDNMYGAFDQPVDISFPKNAETLEDVIMSMQEEMMQQQVMSGAEYDTVQFDGVDGSEPYGERRQGGVQGSNTTEGELTVLASCLAENEVRFYGTYWCTHCESQKRIFGSAADALPYVECSAPDGRGQTEACAVAGITSYPTWVFPSGDRETGELTPADLAARSGCPAPSTYSG